ncbi:MAG TPA: hypothetical protein VF990_15915 [Candidatus Dormibacteraeota bacterium]
MNYHPYDDSWVPGMLAGKTMEEAGRDNFKGDLLGATPKRAFAAVVDSACKAVRDVDDLDSTVHTSFGDFSVRAAQSRTSRRELGAFPPRVEVADDAPLRDRLLGLTGRDPDAA